MRVTTKTLGATDNNPVRIMATGADGTSMLINWNHALDSFENHLAAATRLVGPGRTPILQITTPTGYGFYVEDKAPEGGVT